MASPSTLALPATVAAAVWAGAAALALHERRAAPRGGGRASRGPRERVILPARDEEREVGAAIRSLRALEYAPVEVIVLDDESRDGTLAAAPPRPADCDPRVRVSAGEASRGLVEQALGLPAGAGAARGEWLLFADADVLHAPDSWAGRSRWPPG